MTKLVYCVRRREDVPEDEFHRYWLDEHGPLVRSVADAIGAVRYVQSHTVSPELNAFLRQSRRSAEPYDGITEVWWESLEAVHAGLARAGEPRGPATPHGGRVEVHRLRALVRLHDRRARDLRRLGPSGPWQFHWQRPQFYGRKIGFNLRICLVRDSGIKPVANAKPGPAHTATAWAAPFWHCATAVRRDRSAVHRTGAAALAPVWFAPVGSASLALDRVRAFLEIVDQC